MSFLEAWSDRLRKIKRNLIYTNQSIHKNPFSQKICQSVCHGINRSQTKKRIPWFTNLVFIFSDFNMLQYFVNFSQHKMSPPYANTQANWGENMEIKKRRGPIQTFFLSPFPFLPPRGHSLNKYSGIPAWKILKFLKYCNFCMSYVPEWV